MKTTGKRQGTRSQFTQRYFNKPRMTSRARERLGVRKEPVGAQPLLCVHWWRCKGRRGKGFIPDKCFLPFRDHGLAHVQPQTQCTMTAAAREEKLRGKWKRKEKKKHLEFRIQIVASIKVTGTRENSLKRHYWHSAWPGTLLPLLRKTAMVRWSAFQSGLHRRCRTFWRYNPFLQWYWSQQCLPVRELLCGDAVSWDPNFANSGLQGSLPFAP